MVEAFAGAALEKKQSESLAEILRMHGVRTIAPDPRTTLEEISHANVRRILGDTEVAPSADVRKALEDTPPFHVYFVHNTQTLTQAPKLPLLASRRLEGLGVGTGLNSLYVYNREFLRSDDSVFFDVRLARVPEEAHQRNAYGTMNLFVEPAYARRAGMVSLFNMNSSELRAGWHLSAAEKEVIQGTHDPWGKLRTLDVSTVRPQTLQHWEDARDLLYRLDFTPSDFDSMVKELVTRSLNRLATDDPDRFHAAISALKSREDPEGATEALKRLAFDMNGLGRDYELKIPVAVPPDEFRVVQRDERAR